MAVRTRHHLVLLAVYCSLYCSGCSTLQVPFSVAAVLPWSDARFQQAFASARLLEQQNELVRAEQLYQGLARRHPNRYEVYQRLGVIAQKRGNKDESLAHLRRAKDLSPLNTDVLGDLGYAEYLAGNYQQSVDVFRQAQELNPNHPRIQANLAMALVASGDSSTAHRLFRQNSSDADAYTSMGFALIQHGKMEEGRRAFEKAVQMDPHQERAAEALVQLTNVTNMPSSASMSNNQLAKFGVAVRDGSGITETTGLTIIGEKSQSERSFNRDRRSEVSMGALATAETVTAKDLTVSGFLNRSNPGPRDSSLRNSVTSNQPGAMTQTVNTEYDMESPENERLRRNHDTFAENRDGNLPPYENVNRENLQSHNAFSVISSDRYGSSESHSDAGIDETEAPRRLQIGARNSNTRPDADESTAGRVRLSNHTPPSTRDKLRKSNSSEMVEQAAGDREIRRNPDRSRNGVSNLLANSRGARPAQNNFASRDVHPLPESLHEVPAEELNSVSTDKGRSHPVTQFITYENPRSASKVSSPTDRWNEALQKVRSSSNSDADLQTIAEMLPSQSMTEKIAAWKCLQEAGAKAKCVGHTLLELSSEAKDLEAVESSFAIFRIYGWADYAEHRLRQCSANADPEIRARSMALLKCCRQ